MTQEDKIIELSSTLAYIHMRLGEFYNKGLYNSHPTRKELFFIIKEAKKALDTIKSN